MTGSERLDSVVCDAWQETERRALREVRGDHLDRRRAIFAERELARSSRSGLSRQMTWHRSLLGPPYRRRPRYREPLSSVPGIPVRPNRATAKSPTRHRAAVPQSLPLPASMFPSAFPLPILAGPNRWPSMARSIETCPITIARESCRPSTRDPQSFACGRPSPRRPPPPGQHYGGPFGGPTPRTSRLKDES